MAEQMQVQYFDNDFDALEWISDCQSKPLPLIKVGEEIDEVSQWDAFFHTHNGGQFFKARKYIHAAYERWLDKSSVCLEVGCGHGCSIYPLVDHSSTRELCIIATDYSKEALSIFTMHDKFDPSRIEVRLWDITVPFAESTLFPVAVDKESGCVEGAPTQHLPDSILCLFVLSALHPDHHEASLRHMWSILPPGGVILFRDYGVCDMTMFRHRTRLTENLYRRNDGTLSYYFDLDYVRCLCGEVGFDPVELKYATVQITNKRKVITMKRVFVHAVLMKVG